MDTYLKPQKMIEKACKVWSSQIIWVKPSTIRYYHACGRNSNFMVWLTIVFYYFIWHFPSNDTHISQYLLCWTPPFMMLLGHFFASTNITTNSKMTKVMPLISSDQFLWWIPFQVSTKAKHPCRIRRHYWDTPPYKSKCNSELLCQNVASNENTLQLMTNCTSK